MRKKILVVSDTHGNNRNLTRAISHFGVKGKNLELLIHLGDSQGDLIDLKHLVDCPVKAVRGNCDFSRDFPLADFVQIGEEKALITHGHRYGCKYSLETLKEMALANGASIVMFGHTHEPLVERGGEVTVLNPGSISQPRQAGGRPTYLVITIEEDGTKDYAVVEM